MLGRDLCAALAQAGEDRVTAADRAALDITDASAVRAAVAGHDVVVNCAAYTNVDGAESEASRADAVNGHAVGLLADACARGGARLLQLSTDYVLPGASPEPQPEDAPTGPPNAYGRSKLLGERLLAERLPEAGYVVRTAWLYGEHGGNFVATMLRLAAERPRVDVVDDQHGQPTWTVPLARQLVALGRAAVAGEAPPGVYHGTSGGRTTWHGLARAVFTHAGLDPARVHPTTTSAFPRPAVRPTYSVLAHHRWPATGVPAQPHWEDSLVLALQQPAFQELAAKARG
ncbi:dTDP-4-dehydrorhamnose reductase [Streptacidiphilus neutrinimicus]|uniref:dTDP-4-dehydrorhamnose reductase n=1 Tax=Streptacidiphilus neutrinimicus TaxID=105420 RepID=UPI0005A67CA7